MTELEEKEVLTEEIATEEKELVVKEPTVEIGKPSMWNDTGMFNDVYKMAKIISSTDIIPQAYKGKVGDCLLAIDIANRMGTSPMVVMQNSQVVQGRFSWSGTACKAMIDGCGKYKSTKYVEVGKKGTDDYGVYLEAITKDGEVINGVTVTIKMAKDEGWWGRNPKWKTLTELMLRYRAAAFFMRTECASLAMGFLTVEEQEDIATPDNKPKTTLGTLLREE